MTKPYIGVKIIMAWPEEKNGEPGYGVKYPDGYISWSPKEAFESAYFQMGDDETRITEDMVNRFMGVVTASKLDEKTALVTAKTITGFVQHEVSSCVDPKNFDMEIGEKIARKRIEDTLWKCLGFVLQWGRFGLKN